MSVDSPACFAASVAGDTAQLSFSVENNGNVALRGLQFLTSSDLTSVDCSPSLAATLAVGASLTCSGSRLVSQNELEKGRNSYQLTLQAVNIDPAGASTATVFSRQAILPAVQLPVITTMQVTVSTANCQKSTKARKFQLPRRHCPSNRNQIGIVQSPQA